MSINTLTYPGIRLTCYRIISKTIFNIWNFWRKWKVASDHASRDVPAITSNFNQPYWFHASSVGELESLTEIIFEELSAGHSVVVTIFSESARKPLSRLLIEAKRLSVEKGWTGKILGGFSPPEGEWEKLLNKIKPSTCIVWKYEAWPDLWASLARLGIPLVLLNAKPRSSLKWVKRILFLLGQPSPQLIITCSDRKNLEEMNKMFTHSKGFQAGDPRWDRIQRRSESLNPRVADIITRKSHLPRPWVILGSAWISDMKLWPNRAELSKSGFKGTLWVVPHQVDAHHLSEMETYLSTQGYAFEKTFASESEQFQKYSNPHAVSLVLVNETGILVELYGHCDIAYVGGGFENGVHSTMEPGFFGLSIACGPKNANLFSEIEGFSERGQLKIVNDSIELMSWIENYGCSLLNDESSEKREQEKRLRSDFWRKRTGESRRLVRLIQEAVGS